MILVGESAASAHPACSRVRRCDSKLSSLESARINDHECEEEGEGEREEEAISGENFCWEENRAIELLKFEEEEEERENQVA